MMCSSNINDPLIRAHIDSTPICNRERGSQIDTTVVLIDRDGDLVFNHGNTYAVNSLSFTLDNGVFTYADTTITLPTRILCTPIERIYLGLGYPFISEATAYDIDIAADDIGFKLLLHVLTMMALKDTGLISNHFTQLKQRKYGEHLFTTYLRSITGSSRIGSTNKSVRWLNEQDTLQLKAQLFKTTDYQPTVKSMKYEATELMSSIIEKVFEYFQVIRFKENDITLEPLDFRVTAAQLQQIRLRDTMLLLSNCIGYNSGFIIHPVVTDKHYSRVYSVFTSISSSTRSLLGFINYDIGSALQTICLQLVDQPSLYPLHRELMDDKQMFRTRVIKETGNDMKWVKTELSKIDNLDKMPKSYKQYPTLRLYYDEAQKLRREIIDDADKLIYSRAYLHAKPQWKQIWIDGKKTPEFEIIGKKESSLFFFIWTQYEREIRQAMMSCFNTPEACHEVHDAVYTKEEIDLKLLEDHVLEETGFTVKISH